MKKQLTAAVIAALVVSGVALADHIRILESEKITTNSLVVGGTTITGSSGLVSGTDVTASDDVTAGDDVIVTDDVTVTDDITADDIKANGVRGGVPATQVIAATNTIAADACGGVKRISSASAVTTNTTNTFTAPATSNAGCVLILYNVNAADAITLDNNALFQSKDGADVVLVAKGRIIVVSDGSVWIQASELGDNLA